MTRLVFILLLLAFTAVLRAESGLKILLVVGSGGTETFTKEFAETSALWIDAAKKGEALVEVIGLDSPADGAKTDAEILKEKLASDKSPELWLVFIGHGTFDQRETKFNFRGPDVTDRDLASWADTYEGRLSVINTASASGSFVRAMSKSDRVIITATKNEGEQSYSRFGRYFAEAIAGTGEGDLDNDGQVSLLEAFLLASHRVADFYRTEDRIATEHALIDDNGDQLGSRSEWFEGTTPTKTASPEAKPDGDLAAQKVLIRSAFERLLTPGQREQRDDLERKVVELRRSRDKLPEPDYYAKLEALLLELARLYESVKEGDS
ncbi:MAG: hypothetical protein KDN18_23185 [Verrucomicrobiae bacterium]|nr:hypothetical protein [Verrucomicrobiae bacterium]